MYTEKIQRTNEMVYHGIFFFFFLIILIYKAQFSTNSVYNAGVITLLYLHNHSYFTYNTGYLYRKYHERALHNYFISCHRKYSGQYNQCDIRAAHDGKVGCNTVFPVF